MNATLPALLPEELLDDIRWHLDDSGTSGGQAWAALRFRFEGGNLGRISDMYAVNWAPEPGTLLCDLFGGEYESEKDVQPGEAAGGVAQANEREHDLDSHNMDEIMSLSGLSDCFGMSDDEAGSASGGMGGSARVVTKSDSAYLLDAVALASAVVDARGACMLGLNDGLGSYPDIWVDSGAYPHMVADYHSFVEY
eukprot:jgi/Tetstr1/441420/TSEL_029666.t1